MSQLPVRHRLLLVTAALVTSLITASPTAAQVEAEAITGRPFGVGRITVSDPGGETSLVAMNHGFALEERDGRTFYPVFTTGPVRRLIGRIFGAEGLGLNRSITAYFLFVGDQPLELTFFTPEARSVLVVPRPGPLQEQQELQGRWWREYTAIARGQQQEGDFPPLVHVYLTSMLAGRLGLEAPMLGSALDGEDEDQIEQTLELLAGTEGVRMGTLQRIMAGRGWIGQSAEQPLPADIRWSRSSAVIDSTTDVTIEPIAMHVPEECFYIRFGRFSNYLWMDRFLDEFASDTRTAITLRGHDTGVNEKVQQQLALRRSALGDLFGEAAIADVALIGRDTFLREGPAVGMLFQARNALFGNDLRQKRAAVLEAEQAAGATLDTVQIAGRDVSLLSTPDHRLRSFHAVDGNYHLVTTSRAIVERFFAVSDGQGSLGNLADFRHARSLMPVERQDAIFAYFSSPFLRGLISPQYQIELQRRMQSVAEMELLQLARLAAEAEGQPAGTVAELVAGGFLPRGFGRRADGSRLVVSGTELSDSERGPRGTFKPIPDVIIEAVTDEEAGWYARRADYYSRNWQQMDPVMIGVQRELPDQDGIEHISVEVHVSPFEDTKYGRVTSVLGPPTRDAVRPVPGDLVSIQAMVKGGLVRPGLPPHYLFLGIQDAPIPPVRPRGLFQTLTLLQTTPGYLGSWPAMGYLDMLPIRIGSPPDQWGFSRFPFGLWRRQWAEYSVLSFDQRLLEYLPHELAFEEVERPAQLRLSIGDLSQSQLTSLVNSIVYERARQASVGNAKLLHALSQQLAVPRAEGLTVAEQLLDVRLVCPLGGKYELVEAASGLPVWISTQWDSPNSDRVPAEFQAPLLDWFRGLDAELTKYDDEVTLRAEIDVQRIPAENGGFQLPLFNLFNKPASEEAAVPPETTDPAGRVF